jgi:hypothetical protein
MRSGEYTIRVMKTLFFYATERTVVTDGQTATLNIAMKPNFAAITFNADGDIYVNDERKANGQWSGHLPEGTYKVEVRKASHHPTITSIETKTGEIRTIHLDVPKPIYGSLDVKANAYATIFVDNVRQNATPFLIKRLLIGNHNIELQAEGYHPYNQTINIEEGKTATINAILQEIPKIAALKITSIVDASVELNGKFLGRTPRIISDLPLGNTELTFSAVGYKTLDKTINLVQGNNEIYGELKQSKRAKPKVFLNYVFSPTAPLGMTFGYCKRAGVYLSFKTDVKLTSTQPESSESSESYSYIVEEANISTVDFNEREYYRMALTTGLMVRLFKGCYLYGGFGYGAYGAAYRIANTKAYYCPDLQKGWEVESGVNIVLWNHLALSVGYNTILSDNSQRFGDVHVGIGIAIGKKE